MNTSIEALMKAAQSVPVLGPPVAWVNINKHGDITTPVFAKPTHSITSAELATLREKAAMVDELRKKLAAYDRLNKELDAAIAQERQP